MHQWPRSKGRSVEDSVEKGFETERTDARLAEFMTVQNTYLSTFQSLGGLGLLLGTFGLAVVQLRNVLERRSELALLRATGFRRKLLARLVTLENAALLIGGLGQVFWPALVAVAPHVIAGGAGDPLAIAGRHIGAGPGRWSARRSPGRPRHMPARCDRQRREESELDCLEFIFLRSHDKLMFPTYSTRPVGTSERSHERYARRFCLHCPDRSLLGRVWTRAQ